MGIDNLPDDCVVHGKGVTIDEAMSPSTTIITEKERKYGFETTVSVPPGLIGKFFSTTQVNIWDYDRGLKDECFYIDWDKNNRSWKYRLAVDAQELKNKIECFKKIVANFYLRDKIFKTFISSLN